MPHQRDAGLFTGGKCSVVNDDQGLWTSDDASQVKSVLGAQGFHLRPGFLQETLGCGVRAGGANSSVCAAAIASPCCISSAATSSMEPPLSSFMA